MMPDAKRTQADITAMSRARHTIITDCMAGLARHAPLALIPSDKGQGHLLSEKVLRLIPFDLVSLNSHVTSQHQADVRKLNHSPIPYVCHDLPEI